MCGSRFAPLYFVLFFVVGPLVMTLVFVNLSNDVIERGLKKRRPDYARYIERTSAFFPKLPVSADDRRS